MKTEALNDLLSLACPLLVEEPLAVDVSGFQARRYANELQDVEQIFGALGLSSVTCSSGRRAMKRSCAFTPTIPPSHSAAANRGEASTALASTSQRETLYARIQSSPGMIRFMN